VRAGKTDFCRFSRLEDGCRLIRMIRPDRARRRRRFSGALESDEPPRARARRRCNRCDPFYRFLWFAAGSGSLRKRKSTIEVIRVPRE